jgi:hypothetical protein
VAQQAAVGRLQNAAASSPAQSTTDPIPPPPPPPRPPQVPALGSRRRDSKGELGPYTWLTYSQAGDIRTAIGSGLLQLGVQPKAMVGLYSVNSKEWVLLDAAAHAYGMTTVPLYDTLGPDSVEYICNHAELSVVGCSTAVLPTLASCLARCPSIKLLVVWGASASRLPELPPGVTTRMVTIEQVESLGRRHPRAHVPPRPRDLATICYTSGTTGTPKGAMLSHANLIADAAGTALLLEDFQPGDRHISYLPLAHIYERNNMTVGCHLCGEWGRGGVPAWMTIKRLAGMPLVLDRSRMRHDATRTCSPHPRADDRPPGRLDRVLLGQRAGAAGRRHGGRPAARSGSQPPCTRCLPFPHLCLSTAAV